MTTALALAAANELATLIPAPKPLTATPVATAPEGLGTEAITAQFVGTVSADLVLVTAADAQEALAGSGLTLADALRPALEAASAHLGSGVLSEVGTAPAAVPSGDGVHVFSLDAEGTPAGWFAIRISEDTPIGRVAAKPDKVSMRSLHDVPMTLTVEVGRTSLPVRQVLELVPGSVLELDRAAGSPADLLVNGRLIARGEVVVIDEEFGVRITEILATPEASA